MSTQVSNEVFDTLLENSVDRYVVLDSQTIGKVSRCDASHVETKHANGVTETRLHEYVTAIWKGKYKPMRFNEANENWIMRNKPAEVIEVATEKAPKKKRNKAKHARVNRDNWDGDAVIRFLKKRTGADTVSETEVEALRLLEEANNVIYRLTEKLQSVDYILGAARKVCKSK
jgi:hypothetical protein